MTARSSRLAKARLLLLACLAHGSISCGLFGPFVLGNTRAMLTPMLPVQHKVREPYRKDARLAVLWVGHATALVQIDDKVILTDPVFTSTVGEVSRRLVEPGLDPDDLPPVDAVLISHMHFDHLSLGSLSMIEGKARALLVPQGGLVYVPNYAFESFELPRWETWERDGLRITAVPVEHSGFRYGIDRDWMTTSYTGYVVEYRGLSVYFGGDTAYRREYFAQTRARFPSLDLALIPIAPIHPRDFMKSKHVDPSEAVQAFFDLGARKMVPIHFDTFVNSADAFGEAPRELRRVMVARGLGPDDVQILAAGEQRILIGRTAPGAPSSRSGSMR